jgi:hypothetical protein
LNLKKEFARLFGFKASGMERALAQAGLQLEGTHHRGIDDARNIARLAALVLPQWEAGQTQSSKQEKRAVMHPDTDKYNRSLAPDEQEICNLLAGEIDKNLPEAENKVWHAHPVWFLDGNPVVGYSKLKNCIRLLFWSGQSFEEKGLTKEGNFKAAEARYTAADQVNKQDLKRWLANARDIQWDYKNIVRRKGKLERLK